MSIAIQRVSLADQAVTALLQLIEDNGLKEGDPLPSTSELAETLDVSRTVMREAIAELAGLGLFDRRQGRETVITLPDSRQVERLLHLRFVLQGIDYIDLQEYRQVIEVGSARLAAERAGADDISRMREHVARMLEAKDGDALHEADQAFHREVARASGNDMVLMTIDGITPLLVQLRRRAWAGWTRSGRDVGPIVAAHNLILERIQANDPEGAASAMSDHLAQAREGLEVNAQS